MIQRVLIPFVLCLLAGGCVDTSEEVLRLATTTSTRDSGLLDQLIPLFERQQQVRVDVIAAGTGKALKLGESGEVDVVLVHARTAEDAFIAASHGIRREDVMYNEFEIIGPTDDPAGIRDVDPITALKTLAERGCSFVSRGDDSGTHKRERLLWSQAEVEPQWDDYVETGQGMGATLVIAHEMQAYTLTDHGTYLSFKDKIDLVPLVTSPETLRNPYGALVVNPDKHPLIRGDLANAFVDFLTSPDVQKRIGDFKKSGEALFRPMHLE